MKILNNGIYLLLIDEKAEIQKGGYAYQVNYEQTNIQVIKIESDFQEKMANDKNGSFTKYKIIAYRKLNEEAKELDLPLLPPFEDMNYDELEIKYYQELEERRLVAINFKGQVVGRHPDNLSSHEIHAKVSGFIEGYKAAKSKQFSLEDIKTVIKWLNKNYSKVEDELFEPYEGKEDEVPNDFFYNVYEEALNRGIQSLSTQQLPKEFILSDKFSTFEENLKNGKYKW